MSPENVEKNERILATNEKVKYEQQFNDDDSW